MREIAEDLGLTKTAVLYHFPSKSDIIPAAARFGCAAGNFVRSGGGHDDAAGDSGPSQRSRQAGHDE
ncbi:TetR family transcriptional regulator [Nocardia sp. GCM10030253]|uniref:TetR family transcriptional regulator n=1 Tax=Nocardia sp. GCM10030253 TaxID=3273404 RepID=UPI003626C681